MREALSKEFSKRFYSNIGVDCILGLVLSLIGVDCLIVFFILDLIAYLIYIIPCLRKRPNFLLKDIIFEIMFSALFVFISCSYPILAVRLILAILGCISFIILFNYKED